MTEDRTSFRRLGRDTMIYGIGVGLTRVISFIMLPVYTRYLTTVDYGVLQLLDTTSNVAFILFAAGMSGGLSLFYFRAESPGERGDIVRTTFVLEMSLTLVGTILLLVLAPQISQHLLGGSGSAMLVRMSAVSFALLMLTAVPTVVLQLRQRAQFIITLGVIRLVAQLALNILFVVVLREGVRGLLLSGIIVNSVLGIGLAAWLIRGTPGRFRMDIAKRLRRFGLPYQLSHAGSFILTMGDRFFLQASRGAGAVGIYGLGYQFGNLLYQLSTEQVLKAWNPQRLQLLSEPRETRDAKYDRGFHYFNLILITMATGIGLFIQPVIRLMTTPPFFPAARIVPIILAVYVVQGWGEVTQFGIEVSQRTKYHAYAIWASVIVIVALYATLIPRYGGLGAATATLIAGIVRFLLGYRWSHRLWPVHYTWAPKLRLAAYGAGAVAVSFALPIQPVLLQTALGAALLLLYGVLAWMTVLTAQDRSLVLASAAAPRSFVTALVRRRS